MAIPSERIGGVLLAGAFVWCVAAQAEGIDIPGKPFSYPRYPTDVLGWPGYPEGTLVTPEGYLYTGDAEILFYVGAPPTPVVQRTRVLEEGWMPIIHYDVEQDSISYDFTQLAATFPHQDEEELINFVQIGMTNAGRVPATGVVTCGYRYAPEKDTVEWVHRFRRPARPSSLGGYLQAGTSYDAHWVYRFGDDFFAREHQVLYLWRGIHRRLEVRRHRTLPDLEAGETVGPGDFYVTNQAISAVIGLTSLSASLEPGERKQVWIVVPYRPLPLSFGDMIEKIRKVPVAAVFDRVRATWRDVAAQGMTVHLPEAKVIDTWKASLAYDLIALDRLGEKGEEYVQKVNEFQYDAFWLRDASFIVRGYDLTGYHNIAERCLDHFLRYQQEDGNFVSQKGQLDGWGQALWALGQHVELTKNNEFAKRMFPAVERAVAWLKQAREADPLHLMPSTTPGDAELISGHVTGHNFYALMGLRSAISLARAAGEEQAAGDFQKQYDDLRNTLYACLREVTAATDGAIPPGLDGSGEGEDWGNLISVFPTGVLDPFDPMVTATQAAAKGKFKEGLMTYAKDYLHHYLTTYITETDLARGDQEAVLEQFYAILAHTTATHAGWEWSIRAWGDRDFGGNLSPHGWFAARYRILLRDMLVREDGDGLHLFSVLSPEWIEKRGARVIVSNAPTVFGCVDARLERLRSDIVRVSILPRWSTPPAEIIIHVPWYREVLWHSTGVLRETHGGQVIALPAQEGGVTILWQKISEPFHYSYDQAVKDLLKEFDLRAASSGEPTS
jgi:hypothetical protein